MTYFEYYIHGILQIIITVILYFSFVTIFKMLNPRIKLNRYKRIQAGLTFIFTDKVPDLVKILAAHELYHIKMRELRILEEEKERALYNVSDTKL